jgi:hypothetical protein
VPGETFFGLHRREQSGGALEKRARMLVHREQAHHLWLELGIICAGEIDVLVASRRLQLQGLVEDCPETPMPFRSLAHQSDLRPGAHHRQPDSRPCS